MSLEETIRIATEDGVVSLDDEQEEQIVEMARNYLYAQTHPATYELKLSYVTGRTEEIPVYYEQTFHVGDSVVFEPFPELVMRGPFKLVIDYQGDTP